MGSDTGSDTIATSEPQIIAAKNLIKSFANHMPEEFSKNSVVERSIDSKYPG